VAMNGKKFIAILWVLLLLSAAVYAQSNDDVLSARVDDAVRAQMQEQNIPGVSLAVMRDGKIIKATGYGLANVELNVPVTPQMVFHPESLAKAFTATAVKTLVQEGKIGLDERVSKYLPEAPPAWNEVTIRRLLTHTSGIRDFFGEDGDARFDLHQDFTEDELIRKFAAQTMRFPTGEKWSYCNAGYVMLGVVIHRVTGKFWFDFVKQRIFDPLGMTSTRLISSEDIIPNRVSGYQMVKGEWKNEPWTAPLWTTADGTLYSNVFDMAKWDTALYTEKLIKRSSLEQMWTPVTLNDGTTYPYGFAWRIRNVNGHRLIQHDGVGFAFTTRFARYVDDRLSIIIFMNLGEDDEAAMPTRMTDNVAAIYIPGLGGSSVQTAGPTADAARSVGGVAFAQQLSPAQRKVWVAEESMHRYEQQRNTKRFLSLWDDNFVGWPDYEQRPVRKPEIEKIVVEDFQKPQTSGPSLSAPKPEAIGIFGDVAVTHYLWPEADQTSPTIFRITHTWQRGPEGWHIIGGMSCEVPRSETKAAAPASGQVPAVLAAAKPEDVNTLDSIVAASYEALSGPVGAPRQWARYLSPLDPQARLVSASADATTGLAKIVRWNREEYAASANEYLVKTGFTDRKLGCATSQYGTVATVQCGCEGREQSKLVERGVAMYQLYNDGKRWWINSVVWDRERPGNLIPRSFCPRTKSLRRGGKGLMYSRVAALHQGNVNRNEKP
jgi:CubicO group peptidase (beta-lactamase class C family)